jgi:hypothetical protein
LRSRRSLPKPVWPSSNLGQPLILFGLHMRQPDRHDLARRRLWCIDLNSKVA